MLQACDERCGVRAVAGFRAQSRFRHIGLRLIHRLAENLQLPDCVPLGKRKALRRCLFGVHWVEA
jgi:hypothetical protein